MKLNGIEQYICNVKRTVSPKLINKLVNKMTMMSEFDAKNIKALITYINKEAPDMNIPNEVIPLLAEVMIQTTEVEKNLIELMNTNLARNLTQLKEGKFKIERYSVEHLTTLDKIMKVIKSIFTKQDEVIQLNAQAQDFTLGPQDTRH